MDGVSSRLYWLGQHYLFTSVSNALVESYTLNLSVVSWKKAGTIVLKRIRGIENVEPEFRELVEASRVA